MMLPELFSELGEEGIVGLGDTQEEVSRNDGSR